MDLRIFIPPALMLGSMGALICVIHIVRYRNRRSDRRSPLTAGLLRPPGQALRDQLLETQWDVASHLAVVTALPTMLYALYLQQVLSGQPTTMTLIVVYTAGGLGVFAFVAWKAAVAVSSVRNKTLGLEAEMAAAEEINRLMQQGYTAFHDVPGEKHFNIDHVIVGPAGVFAVETKGRPKKARGSGKQGSTVRFDGAMLQFPGHRETKPLDQAKANADWLRKWLCSAVGESVDVHPVVLLPGWWVDRVGRGAVVVGNAKEISHIVSFDRQAQSITRSLQTRIVHQLDQRCRNIKPKAYAER